METKVSARFLDLAQYSREEGLKLFNLLIACQQIIDKPLELHLWLGPSDNVTPLHVLLLPKYPLGGICRGHNSAEPS
jgi:hypothetical protein